MKRPLLFAAVALLGIAIAANAQQINKSLQLSQDPSSGFGVSTPLGVWMPKSLGTNDTQTPTLGNCGTGAITGTGFAGEVEEGSGSVTTCSVTFPLNFFSTTPYCTASSTSTTTPVAVKATPNGMLVTHIASAALLRWTYICIAGRVGQT